LERLSNIEKMMVGINDDALGIEHRLFDLR
jgi:hypothetical protein